MLADSWESYTELSNSGLLPSLPPPSFSVSTKVQLSRGCKSYFARHFANHKIKNTPAPSKKPPAAQARMMQLEKSLCRDNDTETNCLYPQKFHHPLQKKKWSVPYLQFHITVHQRMVSVTVSAVRIVWKFILDQASGISDGTVRLVRM